MAKRVYMVVASLMLIGLIPFVAKGAANEYLNSYAEKSVSDSITVAGQISNIAEGMPRTVVIIECDISDKSVRKICELDSNNSFCARIPLSYPHTFTINYNTRNFISAFAAPGDSIYLDIDASTTPLSVSFSGDHSEINQQYTPAMQYLNRLINSVSLPSDTVAIQEYMPVFKKYVMEGRDSIDSYAQKHNLSQEVKSMLYAEYLYTLANFACGYRGKNIEEQRAFFLDPIFDIFNDENTKVMIFAYHISAIMSQFADVRDSAPKGTVRDIMYACDEDAPVPGRSVFFNTNYYDRLYADNKPVDEISIDGIKPGSIIVYSGGEIKEISDKNPLEWLINEYKGHPIYLDISATWCGPCRAGLMKSEDLRKSFKDSNIRFAVIWLRSTADQWAKLAPTISNATHIFIDDVEMTDRIMGHLNIQGFPTYLMIDKNGNLIKNNVPRYQSLDLPDFLKSHN
ncbi:MAG: TlpA family protein disulfide reductase [Paramuribaculum sp.]|nr:TlpA family protein disulfide reductase [Paramuribaculum sp.]